MLQDKLVLSEPEPKWLFCYGTLRDKSVYEQLTRAPALPSLPATLQGWIQFEVPGASYPGAVPSRFSDTVQGELRPILTARDWDILDTYEGREYLRVPCVIQTAQGSIEAQIYQYDLGHRHRIDRVTEDTEWQRTVNTWFINESHLSHLNLAAADCGSLAADARGGNGIPYVFVSLLNEVPVGSSRLLAQSIPERSELTPWLASVYVMHELRHLGLGTLLVEATIEKAREFGIRELYLYTEDRQQFFERLGWRTLRVVQLGSSKVTLMHRKISPRAANS